MYIVERIAKHNNIIPNSSYLGATIKCPQKESKAKNLMALKGWVTPQKSSPISIIGPPQDLFNYSSKERSSYGFEKWTKIKHLWRNAQALF